MKTRLAEFAVQLRHTNALWLGECADKIDTVVRDLDRDDALDVADQLRRIADTLSAYADGSDGILAIFKKARQRPAGWDTATQRVALVRGMAVAMRAMAERVARRAA
jgi:hypothetical protein